MKKTRLGVLIVLGTGLVMGAGFVAGSYPPRAPELALRRAVSEDPSGQTVTLLPDGRTLLLGGDDDSQHATRAAALRDPATGQRQPLSHHLRYPRSWHSATVLPDGTVLIFGGVGHRGLLERHAERFDPVTQRFTPFHLDLATRAGHTATLLTDGRVLVVGGIASDGQPLPAGQLWDGLGHSGVQARGLLNVPRYGHTATLLGAGGVLAWGGIDAAGAAVDSGEVFDPETAQFRTADAPPPSTGTEAQVAATMPADGAQDVAPHERLAVRFSAPVTVTTVNTVTVTLTGPDGLVPARVVAAEAGRLAFVTPDHALNQGANYELILAGIADATSVLAPIRVRFSTRAQRPGRSAVGASGSIGDTGNGDTRKLEGALPRPDIQQAAAQGRGTGSRHHRRHWEDLPSLEAPPGVTALAGQVLRISGQPLPGVLLQIEDHVTKSDRTGRFLLTDLTCSHCVLVIDGRPASREGRTYGIFEFGQDIEPGKTNMVMGTLWMPRIDTAHEVEIPSPTPREVVVRTPRIPGLELHLPPNAVIRDKDGRVVRHISITPFSKKRPIMPPPDGFEFPVFFTIQPGGAHIETRDGTGAWLVYPNPTHLRSEKPVSFLSYDPRVKDWFVYGLGRVSKDGSRIVADPGTTFTEFHCTPYSPNPEPPPDMCSEDLGDPNVPCQPTEGDGTARTTPLDGDPVDVSTGVFVHKRADLAIADVIPIGITREYVSQDRDTHKFGAGMTYGYAMHLFSPHEFTEMDLIKPDGSVVKYSRISSGDGFRDAVFEHTGTPTRRFFKSRITWNGRGWDLTLHSGDVYVFGQNYALQAIRNRLGAQVTITRESGVAGRITRVTSPSGRFIDISYNGQNYISQITDNSGRTVSYAYNGNYLNTVTDPDGKLTTYSWGQASPSGRLRLAKITNTRGIQYLKNTYNLTTGRILQQDVANGGTYKFNYTTSNGKVTVAVVTDPRMIDRQLTYDDAGYVLTDTRAKGLSEEQSVSFTRPVPTNCPPTPSSSPCPPTHQVATVTDALSRVTRFVYDANGNVTSLTRCPAGMPRASCVSGTAGTLTTAYTYDPYNQVHTITDPLQHTTTFYHDGLGRVYLKVDALGHQTSYQYNSTFGLVSAVIDPLNHASQYTYNEGDIATMQDPLGNTTSYTYDAVGRRKTTTDPRGYTTQYGYDIQGRLTSTTDPFGYATTFTYYDQNGNLCAANDQPCASTDQRGKMTSFTYGNLDRITKRIEPIGQPPRYEQFTHDLDGNVTAFRDGAGITTALFYDNLNRLKFVGYNQNTTVDPPTYDSTLTYTYDAGNRLRQVDDTAFGTILLTYDDFDRLMSEASCPTGMGPPCANRTIQYMHDDSGRRTTMTVPGQSDVTYMYDDADRLKQITQGSDVVTIAYDDPTNRRKTVTLPNGVSMIYGYDDASYLRSITYQHGATVIGDISYMYDAAGRRQVVDGSWSRVSLPSPMTLAVYDDANELTSWDGASIDHDGRGELKGYGPDTYTWNNRGQLTKVGNASGTVSFAYDGLGRRWKKTDHGATTQYLYAGLNPVQEQDGAGGIIADLLTGIGADEFFKRTEGGQPRYFVTDGLGSTVALTDGAANIVTQYTYEPFGRVTVASGSSTNPYQYAGRENDGTGLYYYRARYYHPGLSQFISPDPLAQLPRLPVVADLYAYANNAPTIFIDPLGLDPSMRSVAELQRLDPPVLSEDPIRDGLIFLSTLGVGTEAEVGLEAGEVLAAEVEADAVALGQRAEGSFFEATEYTEKVLEQMTGGPGEFHSFPESVAAFEDAGTISTVTGGDGVTRELLEIPGEYSGREGTFQFMKDPDGSINHRYFLPND